MKDISELGTVPTKEVTCCSCTGVCVPTTIRSMFSVHKCQDYVNGDKSIHGSILYLYKQKYNKNLKIHIKLLILILQDYLYKQV